MKPNLALAGCYREQLAAPRPRGVAPRAGPGDRLERHHPRLPGRADHPPELPDRARAPAPHPGLRRRGGERGGRGGPRRGGAGPGALRAGARARLGAPRPRGARVRPRLGGAERWRLRLATGVLAAVLGLACATGGAPVVHEVKPGENLYRIASYYDVSVSDILRENGIADPRELQPGQRLRIPHARRAAGAAAAAPARGPRGPGGLAPRAAALPVQGPGGAAAERAVALRGAPRGAPRRQRLRLARWPGR